MTSHTENQSRFRRFWRVSSFYLAFIKHIMLQKFQRQVELRDPQQVLRENLKSDVEVLSVKTDDLVKFGDNYTSTIVKATIDVKINGRTERLDLVAKMIPSSAFLRQFLQCDVLMAKEIFLYAEIIPAYQQLCDGDFDIAPKFYGGRYAVEDSDGSDEGTLLLMENLKELGYVLPDRHKGLTMEHLRLAVPLIAKFHAIGFAMKQKNPDFFEKIKEHSKPFELPPEISDSLVSKILNTVKNKRELSPYYERVKLLANCDSNGHYILFKDFDSENPYACLIHRDLWINNTMFHVDDSGKIDGFKFFDFQVYGISSPMTDLMYFLFTSLPREFEDFDEAVKLYQESICDQLKKLNCNSSWFEAENFDRRLDEDAKTELLRCLAMANNIELQSKWDIMRVPANTLKRMKRILEIYDSKGWLDIKE